jgi:hypothetical protein
MARQLGGGLSKREVDSNFVAGKAATSKSEHVRRTYKVLRRRASKTQVLSSTASFPSATVTQMTSLQGSPMVINQNDQSIETSPLEHRVSPSNDTFLVFRIFDKNSGTVFQDGSFTASFFSDRRNGVSIPIPKNDIYGLYDIISQAHLSTRNRHGSFLISVSTSLLDVMVKAQEKNEPMLALIDLASLKNQPNKVQHASSVIRHLKKDLGELGWTRCKYIVTMKSTKLT